VPELFLQLSVTANTDASKRLDLNQRSKASRHRDYLFACPERDFGGLPFRQRRPGVRAIVRSHAHLLARHPRSHHWRDLACHPLPGISPRFSDARVLTFHIIRALRCAALAASTCLPKIVDVVVERRRWQR
jgi:hypothetical protein